MKKIISIMLAVLLVLVLAVPVFAAPYSGIVTAESVLLVHGDTGEVLYSKNETDKVYPAGTTKLMTALVAYELCPDMDETFEVTYESLDDITEWSDRTLSPMLYSGETLTMRDLLCGILIASGNDAASVAAYCTAGSIDEFVAKMNSKAASLGMTGTHYTNPHGRSGEEHFTTASDMVKLIQAVYEKPELLKILEMKTYTIEGDDYTSERELESGNLFYEGDTAYNNARGSLGGYTDSAGSCLVSGAEENGVRLYCVVFGEPVTDGAWNIAKNLYEYAFDLTVTYTASELFSDIELVVEDMTLTPDYSGITIELSKYQEIDGITTELVPPADKNSEQGSARYFTKDGKLLAEVPVTFVSAKQPVIWRILKIVLIVAVCIFAFCVIAYFVLKSINDKRERERARRRAEREALRAQRLEEEKRNIDFSEFLD